MNGINTILTVKQALVESRKADSRRETCAYCARLMAENGDCVLFEDAGSHGGERPDLCWSLIAGDHACDPLRSLHEYIHDSLAGIPKRDRAKVLIRLLELKPDLAP
jgi:hypothetical protein